MPRLEAYHRLPANVHARPIAQLMNFIAEHNLMSTNAAGFAYGQGRCKGPFRSRSAATIAGGGLKDARP